MDLEEIIRYLLDQISYTVTPLKRHLSSPHAFVELLERNGWQANNTSMPEIEQAFSGIHDALNVIYELFDDILDESDEVEVDTYLKLIKAMFDLISTVEKLTEQATEPPGLTFPINSPQFWDEFPSQLLKTLLLDYLRQVQPLFYSLFLTFGVITEELMSAEGKPGRIDFKQGSFHSDRLPKLITNPLDLIADVYNWGSPDRDFNFPLFMDRLNASLDHLGFGVDLQTPSESVLGRYFTSDNTTRSEIKELKFIIASVGDVEQIGQAQQVPANENTYEISLKLMPIPPRENFPSIHSPDGIIIYPAVIGKHTYDLTSILPIRLSGGFLFDEGVKLQIHPGNVTAESSMAGAKEAEVSISTTALFGSPDWTPRNIRSISGQVGLRTNFGNLTDFFIEIDLTGLRVSLNVGDNADGFLKKILPGDDIGTEFDLTVGWSTVDGIYFRGSATIELTIPVHEKIGPLNIDSVYVIIKIDGTNFVVQIAVSIGVVLGPVAASVDRIGIEFPISIAPDRKGNLGLLNVDSPGFVPPRGAGLSISAAGIVGGGFIQFDRENERYAGILGLSFGKIGLTAIGLIATKMPDGSKGFSMLINIGVIFSPPIQLVMGFTLSGVGGLVGINRSMQIDVLRAGLKNRTLDSILFPDPKTVVANASKIISDSNAVFLPVVGRHIVAPMVKIGWGNNIITADIGIFIEFPSPIRIVLMGQVEANLPKPDKAVVVIHLDILGVLDIEKKELTFQATLYDSRILKYTLSGDSAFLLGWGQDRRFALSLGGFHPKFTPPPPPIVFANLTRLSLSLSSGNNFQISASAYQALTPNSLQFGARVELYASKAGATVTGHLGFDTLIYFSPFSFEVEISGGVRVKYKGYTLSEVNLSMTLSGPTPWNARGKVKFKLLGVSIKKEFDFTWGDAEQVTLPSIDPWEQVLGALNDSGNWGSALPANQSSVEYLRSLEGEAPGQIILHPAGQVEVRQNVVPLDVSLSLFGNAPITGHDLFKIKAITIENASLSTTPESVDEFFARGQYEQLTSQQKISLPSFEKMKGGVRVSFDDLRFDGATESEDITYESIILGEDGTLSEPDNGKNSELAWEDAQFIIDASAARRASMRAGPGNRFSTSHTLSTVDVPKEELYCIAKSKDLKRAKLSSINNREIKNCDLTRMNADYTLQDYLKDHSDMTNHLIVIPEYEVAT